MNLHATKTDNAHIESKIHLRQLATKGLKELRVLDCFAGENKLWESFDKKRYFGIEKVKDKGNNLYQDNLRVIKSLDLSQFNVIDLDSYGIPANQIAELYNNSTLKKGSTVIIYTCITSKMSGLNKTILKMFNMQKMYKKSKVLLNAHAKELFYAMLYNYGVKKVYEYSIEENSYKKTYGYFKVE